MVAPIELTGQRFGRLTVLGRAPGLPRWKGKWQCRCDCGGEKVVWAPHMRTGRTSSCGCIKREHLAKLSAAKVTHGRTHTVEYRIWGGMINRCTDQNNKNWLSYGGRGIKVCQRWRDFANFFADMGERPSNGLSIDRIDNDGDYEPGNCRWATPKVQARNTRANVLYTYAGRTMPLCVWADESGLRRTIFYWRFAQGWRGHRLFSRT